MPRFSYFPKRPINDKALMAYYILSSAHGAASSFLDLFEKERQRRQAKGTPTDEEQDLLRAMLVFSSSGLDSMVKQLVADTLQFIILKDEGARELFRGYIEARLKKGADSDYRFLSSILAHNEPKVYMINHLVYYLQESSLQSKDQLLKVASHFNIPSRNLTTDFTLLQTIFEARNQIAHEMDIDFNQKNRSRRPRRRDDMIKYTTELFRISDVFLKEVDLRLN